MKRTIRSVVLLVAACCAAFFLLSVDFALETEAQQVVLPGAEAVVEAAFYPSLQAAVDAVPPTGGMVRLPPGRFEISGPLVVTQNDILIQGSGAATHIVNRNEQGSPALILRPQEPAAREEATPQWRIQLSDFRITGNETSGPGILAIRVNELFIDGVSVSYHGDDGIRLDHCYEDPRISNSLITYNKKTGLNLIGCHDIVVSGNQFEENLDALHCIDGYNLCMTGNSLDDHLGDGVVIENTYGSVVSGNMIEECRGTAIVLDRDCYGITLGSNVIAHNGGGIALGDAHGCAVSANTFTINRQFALRIGAQGDRITVTGNNFSNSYIGEGKTRRDPDDLLAGGLILESTSEIVASGNVFSSVRPKALELAGKPSRSVIFSSNLLVEAASDHNGLTDSLVVDLLEVKAQ